MGRCTLGGEPERHVTRRPLVRARSESPFLRTDAPAAAGELSSADGGNSSSILPSTRRRLPEDQRCGKLSIGARHRLTDHSPAAPLLCVGCLRASGVQHQRIRHRGSHGTSVVPILSAPVLRNTAPGSKRTRRRLRRAARQAMSVLKRALARSTSMEVRGGAMRQRPCCLPALLSWGLARCFTIRPCRPAYLVYVLDPSLSLAVKGPKDTADQGS